MSVKLFVFFLTITIFSFLTGNIFAFPVWECSELYSIHVALNDTTTSRSFKFIYNVVLPHIPKTAKGLSTWVPLPQSDNFQKISNIKIECPVSYTIDWETEYNNKFLNILIKKNIPESLQIRITFNAQRKIRIEIPPTPRLPESENRGTGETENAKTKPQSYGRGRQFTDSPIHPFTDSIRNSGRGDLGETGGVLGFRVANELIPIDAKIKKEAKKVTINAKSDIDKAKAIYDHIVKTVTYDKSGTGWGRGDALYVCNVRTGNCTDFHSLFIALCRSVGIPARFVIGFPLPEKKTEGEITGYHCWAEFFIKDKGWIPVDASEAYKNPEKKNFFFGNLDYNRIQFTIGRDIEIKNENNTHTLNYFIYPFCTVDSKPYFDVKSSFYFKNIF